jgi:predicted neutral ceramidase superfamily lipid hydrolase
LSKITWVVVEAEADSLLILVDDGKLSIHDLTQVHGEGTHDIRCVLGRDIHEVVASMRI